MSLSDFLILNKIGQGSYSSVHKVKRISDGKQYALKKVRIMTLKQKQKQNSLNQIRILASIESQYIISYKEAFIDQISNSLCLIMEYANDGDLQKKIESFSKKNTYFQQSQIWKIANNILNGLGLLHKMNILHRDIKSANIFICNGLYKLGDMNVSKILKKGLAYTQTGTPYYASPQVWRDQPYDSKSDIWSFGCVLYQACALKPPFNAKNMQGLFKKVQKGVFDRIPSFYSQQLQQMIRQCLQLNHFKRPSCQELLNKNKFLQMSNLQYSPINQNLIDTIKIPKNLMNLKQMLPKNKYQIRDTNSKCETERVPSRKSESNYLRYRNSSIKSILKKNASQRIILPQIKKNVELINKYNQYYAINSESKNVADNKLKYKIEQKKLEDQKILREKIKKERVQSKESQRFKQKIYLKQKNLMSPRLAENNKNIINMLPQLPMKKDFIKLPPLPSTPQISSLGKQHKIKIYQYQRPSWWG